MKQYLERNGMIYYLEMKVTIQMKEGKSIYTTQLTNYQNVQRYF